MSRLTIDIDPDQHRQIKTLATFSGMTIKDFILNKTLSQKRGITDETEYLMGSESNAKRLRAALATPRKKHLVFKSLKDLENALGI